MAGAPARTAASLVEVDKTTAAFYLHRLRAIVAQQSEDTSPVFGEIEGDESYFGGHRMGKRGRGAAGKVPVFGLLRRGGKVYAKVIPVLDVSTFKHLRINHPEPLRRSENHINGIENFWNQAKQHMRKFNGVPGPHFHLF